MNDGVYYMMLHKYKNQIDNNKKKDNNLIRMKPCIKTPGYICKKNHVRFKGEWCTFFRFMYN